MSAPLALFVYNRPRHLQRTLEGLLANADAAETDLVVFSDGPGSDTEEVRVDEVRQLSDRIGGFKKVRTVKREQNLGLAASIRSGVNEMLAEHESVIVLEDDLWVGPYFLAWMQAALRAGKDQAGVMSVSGYVPPRWRLRRPADCPAVWLSARPMSWGWGTWRDRWASVDWEAPEQDGFCDSDDKQKAFAERLGADAPGMLKATVEGRLDSWAIRFAYAHACQKRFALLPRDSHVRPLGFDGSGVHCRPNPMRWFETVRHAGPPKMPEVFESVPEMQQGMKRLFDRHHRWIGRWIEG